MNGKKKQLIEKHYAMAREIYAGYGVNTDQALKTLSQIPISLHCWQGDDVNGFEKQSGGTSGGILATGNYFGRASSPAELRKDLNKAFELIPGAKRLNLHAIYLDTKKSIERNKIKPEHFAPWIDWAQQNDAGLDFNPTFFGHPMAASNLTLSSPDSGIRDYWIEHGQACRKIAAAMGRELGKPCIMNVWIPDGFKDVTIDRMGARQRLKTSLDALFTEKISHRYMRDAVESKLFGIGVETCTVGSAEFYLGYAAANKLLLCLDAGHFHPTEQISDKISSALLYVDELLLHVSRPVRWDSDHVVTFDDELQAIARECVNCGIDRIHIGLDYFDATINRIAAWAIGSRNMQKALLKALLEPYSELKKMEKNFCNTQKLLMLEELKSLPLGIVYDYYCLINNVVTGGQLYDSVMDYERKVLQLRSIK
jgi:L-rhamnose isomerase